MQRNCPVCFDFLFDSLEAPQVLRCGHTIHRRCLEEYHTHGGYTCPLCCQSVCDMTASWAYMDEQIAQTPLPPELDGRVIPLLCNDCHAEATCDYHPLGLKCPQCGSYNTRQR
jgi:RING finger/CHY zinc finger protein 1